MSTDSKTAKRGGPRLRPDTTLSAAESPDRERYLRELPECCLRSFKVEAATGQTERRLLSLECGCGRSWRVTSSLDERVLGRFVVHGGPRVGGAPPAA